MSNVFVPDDSNPSIWYFFGFKYNNRSRQTMTRKAKETVENDISINPI